jgi:hypothetical protein
MSSIECGHDNMMAYRNSAEDDESCDTVLQAAFRKLAKESSIRTKEEGIGVVLVFGEKVDDKKFSLCFARRSRTISQRDHSSPQRECKTSHQISPLQDRERRRCLTYERRIGGSLREKIVLGRMSCELRR